MSNARRFLDALLRVMAADQRDQVEQVLIVGPGIDDPIDDLLAAYPMAQFSVVELDNRVAGKLARRLANASPRVSVLAGDASNPELFPHGPYDLVISRHLDVARHTEKWGTVLRVCAERLAPGAILTVSAYSLPEIASIDQVLQGQPVDMMPGSPYTAEPVPLQGTDRYLLMVRKRE